MGKINNKAEKHLVEIPLVLLFIGMQHETRNMARKTSRPYRIVALLNSIYDMPGRNAF